MKVVVLLLALCSLACSRKPMLPRSLADQHARVDALLQMGYLAGAERQLDRMWRTLRWNRADSTRFGRQALQDVAFRLGQVMLEEKKPGEALDACTRGLALGEQDDLFTANLLILRGNILQELGKPLPAAEDFHRALVINQELLHKVLNP
jgi:predicted negative regulator of RcsB-dependent stress response